MIDLSVLCRTVNWNIDTAERYDTKPHHIRYGGAQGSVPSEVKDYLVPLTDVNLLSLHKLHKKAA